MDYEAINELLGKYLLPLITTDWKQFLLSALPSIVTIVTIVTSSVLQIKASKRESERIIAQNNHTIALEKEKEDAARRATLLNKQIDEINARYDEMLALYYPMADALCDLALCNFVEKSCCTIHSNAIKLLCLTPDHSILGQQLRDLIDYMDKHITPNISNSPKYLHDVRWRVQEIGSLISDQTLKQAMIEGAIQTEITSSRAPQDCQAVDKLASLPTGILKSR